MPSDDPGAAALEALVDAREAYRSALATAADELRAHIETHVAATNGSAAGALHLGRFGESYLDADRFAAVFLASAADDAAARTAETAAHGTLTELLDQGDALFRLSVPSGGDLVDVVLSALATAGRAFAAAQVAAQARRGQAMDDLASLTRGFPFSRWNRGERRVAPPLIVEVDGADLRTGGLAEVLVGTQKLVLVVRGAAPPAPLVRLITPAVYVAQLAEPGELAGLAGWDGPGVAMLGGKGAARFVHDPATGGVTLGEVPEREPQVGLGGMSAFQQVEELRQLRLLAGMAEVAATASGEASASAAPADPTDKLAAWLLHQAQAG